MADWGAIVLGGAVGLLERNCQSSHLKVLRSSCR